MVAERYRESLSAIASIARIAEVARQLAGKEIDVLLHLLDLAGHGAHKGRRAVANDGAKCLGYTAAWW